MLRGNRTMQIDELRYFLDYDAWATERLMAAAEQLNADGFAANAGPGHVAPRDSLLHCISGMRTWRERLQSVPATAPAAETDDATLAQVRTLWRAEHAKLEAYATGLAETDLEQV